MTISAVLSRVLNRLKVLQYFNLIATVLLNERTYKIPLLNRTGHSHLYAYKDYDYRVYDFFRKDIVKGIFLDIGASIGQTLLKVNAIDPAIPIVSLEPNPNCLHYLYELKKANKFDNLTIIPSALAEDSGLQKLYVLSSFDTGASLIFGNRENYFDPAKFFYVNSINGEQLKSQLSTRVSFIKIDVEGAELGALKALKEIIDRDKPIIYCEVLDAHNENRRERKREFKASLHSFVATALNYQIFSLDTTSGTLTSIVSFPDRVYDARNLDHCNYLFLSSGI